MSRSLLLILSAAMAVSGLSSCKVFRTTMPRPTKPWYNFNEEALSLADPAKTSLEIRLSKQTATLRDENDTILVQTLVSTGTDGHETPPGNYVVLERLEHKASSLYGRLVDSRTGKVVMERAWELEGPPPPGTEIRGIDMPYWLRFTWDGIGMHVGKFEPYTRSSFGCIRVPAEVQPKIWEKTVVGTPVEIIP
jgi:hypothetical protein